MADLRLLIRLGAAILLAGAGACALGPIWAEGIRGQVVDRRTGDPVAGAEVFVAYDMEHATSSYPVDVRWVTTDDQGRFEIPGRVSMMLGPPFSWTVDQYFILVLHPDFGSHGVNEELFESFPSGRIEIEPEDTVKFFEHPSGWVSLCGGLTSEACDRICEMAPKSCATRPDFE